MNAIILVWNPEKGWKDFENDLKLYRTSENPLIIDWNVKTIKTMINDKVFIYVSGIQNKGIFASGKVVQLPYKKDNQYFIDIEIDKLVDPENDSILSRNSLPTELTSKHSNILRSSGSSVITDNNIISAIDNEWDKVFQSQNLYETILKEYDKNIEKEYREGKIKEVISKIRERDYSARIKCLEFYKSYKCQICEFDFEKTYGEIGKEFIHVHHINQHSSFQGEHLINPINDLIPVCPNCHAMIHRSNEPLSIDNLKSLISKRLK
jgi:5-methylcytosine-specific restriction enzyme A